MAARQRRFDKQEFAARGKAIFDSDVQPNVSETDKRKFVAIDIETGSWEMDVDEIVAGDRLRHRIPDAQTWMSRVGYDYIRRFGAANRNIREIMAPAYCGNSSLAACR